MKSGSKCFRLFTFMLLLSMWSAQLWAAQDPSSLKQAIDSEMAKQQAEASAMEAQVQELEKEAIKKRIGVGPVVKKDDRAPSQVSSGAMPGGITLKAPQSSPAEKEFFRLKKLKEGPKPFVTNPVEKLYGKSKLSEGEILYRTAISDGKVTLKEAIGIGLASNVAIKADSKKIELAKSKLDESRRAFFPTAQLVAEYNGGIAGQRAYKGKSTKANITQPVFDGGELRYTLHQAELNLKTAEEQLRKSKNELIDNIKSAYYGAVKAEYNTQYQTALYGEIQSIYQRVRKEHDQKLIADVDYLNVESQYQQITFKSQSSGNDLLTAHLLLFQALGIDDDGYVPVDLELQFFKLDPDTYEILELAMRSNPDIRMKQLALESSEFGTKIFKARKYPKVELRGSYGKLGEAHHDTQAIEEGKTDIDTEKEWFLGVNAGMPLGANSIEYDQVKHVYGPTVLALTGSEDWRHKIAFNLFDRLPDITDEKNAQAVYLQSQQDLTKAQNDVIVKVKDETYSLKKSLVKIDSVVARIRYQEKRNKILEYLVSMQEASIQDLLEGLSEQAQNRFSFIEAVADYHISISSLSTVIGDPNTFEDKYKR